MSVSANPEGISPGLFGRTRTAILSLLYGRADESFYLRQLVRETGAGNGAVQREVKQLTDAGLIVRENVGNLVFYQANRKSPVFSELRGLLLKTAGVRDVLREAIAPLKNRIQVAFVYGSIAAQKDRADSDVDLMIIGDATFDEVVPRLSDAQKRLRREINPTIYPVREFRAKLESGNHFLTSVLQSKKLFVFGNENDLRELSTKRLAKRPQKQSRRNPQPAGRRGHKDIRL
jgi:predicted nucleotidyltransferase